MGSFKFKLVAYFALLSVLPIAAAFWGFSSVAGQSETSHVDARLQAGLRASLAGYQEQLDAAQARAKKLARARAFQVALQSHDETALAAMLRGLPDVYVASPSRALHVGHQVSFAARREVAVFARRGFAGTVTAYVPFDTSLVAAMRARSGFAPADTLVLVRGTRIVAASPVLAGTLALGAGHTETVRVAGERYRALVGPPVGDIPGVRFAVLSPQSLIDHANARSRDRLLIGLLVSLALVAFVAFVEGRSIVRTLRGLAEAAHAIARGSLAERVPVRGRDEFAVLGTAFNEMANQLEERLGELEAERARMRDAITRFGDALAASHDIGQLLRVVVEASAEATGAHGARLDAAGGDVVERGDPNAQGEQLVLPITAGHETFGVMTLVGPGFDAEQRMTASSLVSQAAIALENARLHRIVEGQALVDGLTGVANRRQCEDALTTEVARAERQGLPLTLVLADLDGFKAINDEHGHATGDEVLREFASVMRATIRDADLAGRWGGEEFVLLLPGTDAAGAVLLADRVRSSLAERSFLGSEGAVLAVTCSFGVAQHRPGADERELFAAADRALYRAKGAGKNRVEVDAGIRSF